MTILENVLLGWLLVGGMVLYALTLTAVRTGRRVSTLFTTNADGRSTASR